MSTGHETTPLVAGMDDRDELGLTTAPLLLRAALGREQKY
jgi:hypothetical protein